VGETPEALNYQKPFDFENRNTALAPKLRNPKDRFVLAGVYLDDAYSQFLHLCMPYKP